MSVTPDIIMQLRGLAKSGSKVERRLAALVLSDVDFASRASIATLAERAETSQPSVTRLCRELGCEGIREFKLKLAQALAVGELYLTPPPADAASREERIVADVCDTAVETILAVRQTVAMEPVMRAAERIAKARQVYIYGSGGISSLGAVELQNRLFRFSIPAIAHVDGQMQQMTAAVADPETVVVVMSSSGAAPAALDAAEIARHYGATVIAVAPPGSPLSAAATIAVAFEAAESRSINKPSASRYALLVLIDLLAMATAEILGEEAVERMRRVRLALSPLKRDSRSWPLGD